MVYYRLYDGVARPQVGTLAEALHRAKGRDVAAWQRSEKGRPGGHRFEHKYMYTYTYTFKYTYIYIYIYLICIMYLI